MVWKGQLSFLVFLVLGGMLLFTGIVVTSFFGFYSALARVNAGNRFRLLVVECAMPEYLQETKPCLKCE